MHFCLFISALARIIIRSVAARTRDPIDPPAGLSDGEIAKIISVVALNIFTNIIGKATRGEIDFPKVALLDLPVRAAA